MIDQLARAYRDDPEYAVDTPAGPAKPVESRATPDLTVTRRHRVVHLFRVAELRDLQADDARHAWEQLGQAARAMGATFWLMVPSEALDTARSLVAQARIPARLATWNVALGGAVRFEWL
ncbi:MAG: hypothetical protein ACOZNI_33690 [Myxococcota bacterium]